MFSMQIPLLHILQSRFQSIYSWLYSPSVFLTVHQYCVTLCLALSWVTCEAIWFNRAVDGVEKQVNWAWISTLACCCRPSHVKRVEMWSSPPLDPFTRLGMIYQMPLFIWWAWDLRSWKYTTFHASGQIKNSYFIQGLALSLFICLSYGQVNWSFTCQSKKIIIVQEIGFFLCVL